MQSKAGLFLDWGPDQGNYYPHIDVKTEPDIDKLIELVANKDTH